LETRTERTAMMWSNRKRNGSTKASLKRLAAAFTVPRTAFTLIIQATKIMKARGL